jgi:TorA maturation chaperone TorD
MALAEPAIIPLGAVQLPLSQEDQARADLYALIAHLLLRPPDMQLLAALGSADSLPSRQLDNPLDSAWNQLTVSASLLHAESVYEEFSALFLGIGTPAVNPYGSYYLSGFMMEKPLAVLRDHLAELGLARMQGVGEPEDHLGALCEVMHFLIAGAEGVPQRALQEQKTFFFNHVLPWYRRCFDDIRRAEGASFYRHVADFAQAFLDVEFQAFEMEDVPDAECELE